jgi:hypothetical protein
VIDRSDSFYETVPALGDTVKDQVPPAGKTWEIVRFVGSAAYLAETSVKLVWDQGGAGEEVLASTHGDSNVEFVRQVVGDGIKKLALVLENTSQSGQALGARYTAREL